MKKNLTKLALSGAALAAVAATLGTSTYAWYTTNPTVSANNIVGASSDTGASSIYISKDTDPKNWSSEVTFGDTDFNTAKLVPVQPKTTTTGSGDDAVTTVNAGSFTKLDNSDATATEVLSFSLWFKSSKVADEATADNGIDLYLKSITIANTTASLKPADNLLYGNTEYGASGFGVTNQQPTYNVDFVKALGMQIVDSTATATTKQTFALAPFQTNTGATAYATAEQSDADNNFVAAGKAHEYYNQVMATDLTSGDITAGKAKTGKYTKAPLTTLNATGTNDTARKLTFYVYLNGWNEYCYDACQGQQFTLNLQFTKVADDARASIV